MVVSRLLTAKRISLGVRCFRLGFFCDCFALIRTLKLVSFADGKPIYGTIELDRTSPLAMLRSAVAEQVNGISNIVWAPL